MKLYWLFRDDVKIFSNQYEIFQLNPYKVKFKFHVVAQHIQVIFALAS